MSIKRVLQKAASLLLLTVFLHPSFARAQGSLTPPGAPTPTMKSLSQIEPRTPVDAVNTPGDSGAIFIISAPGSYYLTGNITGATNEDGIYIGANDVTLDLNGFVLTGSGSSYGIWAEGQDITIRNGVLLDWEQGVVTGDACEIDHVRIYNCLSGINAGNECAFRNCVVMTNGGYGLTGRDRCVIADCLAISNEAGIFAGSDCIVSGCQAIGNRDGGISLYDNFNVSKCTADYSDNSDGFNLGICGVISDCVANTNYNGISPQTLCTIRDCIAIGNLGAGISTRGDSVVTGNHASGNEFGIYTLAGGNLIENNQTRDNAIYGIESVEGAGGDIIVRNRSSNNGSGNYLPSSNTNMAPVQSPATATSPWANF